MEKNVKREKCKMNDQCQSVAKIENLINIETSLKPPTLHNIHKKNFPFKIEFPLIV